MPTYCRPASLDLGIVEDRAVVVDFRGGAMTSGAGALLLGRPTGRSG
jgi:hypothetical protein